MTDQHLWWQTGIIYQVYPRSFQDSNGDGIGDLPGVRARLDYIQSLNVKGVWLSPIYPSPMHDFGYDVADYCGINPIFGTMADFDALLHDVHSRGMKLVLDLVPNHTSDEHRWFQESRSSRDNPKRDWYIWRDPGPDGGPPNNWLSYFGGPAWTYDEHTGQYYMHQFVRQQPELNYRNPQVLAAMLEAMRFWLDKGVDGFRVDVIWLMIKDEQLRDEEPNTHWNGVDPFDSILHRYNSNQPEVHDIIRAMRKLLDEYDERMMVGEIYLPVPDLMQYYGLRGDEAHLPFNFQLIDMPWRAATVRRAVDEYEASLPVGGWPNWVLGNHDKPRLASRVGQAQARVATMMLLTLRGTPTCYYGDEIGMENVPIPAHMIQDPPAVKQPEIAHLVGRDPERTPMQWDDSPNAGFAAAGVETWLPLGADYAVRNVAVQTGDGASFLAFFRQLTALRQGSPALLTGHYRSIDIPEADVFAYTRLAGEERYLVVLNFGTAPHTLDLSSVSGRGERVLSTRGSVPGPINLTAFELRPDEGVVVRVG